MICFDFNRYFGLSICFDSKIYGYPEFLDQSKQIWIGSNLTDKISSPTIHLPIDKQMPFSEKESN